MAKHNVLREDLLTCVQIGITLGLLTQFARKANLQGW
jgi:hypothetical protein